MEGIVIGIAVVAMLVGAIRYNPLRRKWAGIIGVGGSYLILIGVMLLVTFAASFIRMLVDGTPVGKASDIIVNIVFMVVCLLYTAYVMLTRCSTTQQRIMLPIVACLIGLGFCWRFLAALLLHIPMESGNTAVKFPAVVYDPNNNEFRLQSDSGDHADYYCQATGQTVQFWEADIQDGLPSGWRR